MDDFEKVIESMSIDSQSLHSQLFSLTSIINIVISIVVGLIIFEIYYYSTSKSKRDLNMCQVIPALSVLMTVIMRMEGGRVAIFFGIFGVLSIVRFRSELTDQKGITFILFGLISGLLIGLGNYILALLGIIALALIYFGLKKLVLKQNKVLVQIKVESLSESLKVVEAFMNENKIKYVYVTPHLKFEINKSNVLENFTKLRFFIYYKSNIELIEIYEKMNALIQANNMQIEISDKF